MLEKLKLTEEKYNDIAEKLMDPNVINDTKAYASYMKEYKSLTPIVEKYREYCKILSDKTDAEELLDINVVHMSILLIESQSNIRRALSQTAEKKSKSAREANHRRKRL